jgi:hypothetical protein
MSTEAMQPPFAECDLLSEIAILHALLARHGHGDDRSARWQGNLNRARTQLEALRAGDAKAPIHPLPTGVGA